MKRGSQRCQATLDQGFRPSWDHSSPMECGKVAYWITDDGLRGKIALCTRHAKARGLHRCFRINMIKQL